MKEQYFKCSCSSEILRVSHDEELDLTEFSVWEMQNSHKAGWRQRLRWCWRILTKGSPYGDQVILREQEIADMVDYLIETQNKKHDI